jgi:hypothetical protein
MVVAGMSELPEGARMAFEAGFVTGCAEASANPEAGEANWRSTIPTFWKLYCAVNDGLPEGAVLGEPVWRAEDHRIHVAALVKSTAIVWDDIDRTAIDRLLEIRDAIDAAIVWPYHVPCEAGCDEGVLHIYDDQEMDGCSTCADEPEWARIPAGRQAVWCGMCTAGEVPEIVDGTLTGHDITCPAGCVDGLVVETGG